MSATERRGLRDASPPGRARLGARWPHSRVYWAVVATVIIAYLALSVAVVLGSPLDILDRHVAGLDLARHWPDASAVVSAYVIVGQRGPAAALGLLYAGWRARREHTLRPVVTLLLGLLLLNVSVGAIKLATGRLGPQLTSHARAVLVGGDIFPSGHTSNAVVVFGVLALITARYRHIVVMVAIWISVTVGLSTIFLDTHWVTDVIGGWLAGGLVLLAIPLLRTPTDRLLELGIALLRSRNGHAVRGKPFRTRPSHAKD